MLIENIASYFSTMNTQFLTNPCHKEFYIPSVELAHGVRPQAMPAEICTF